MLIEPSLPTEQRIDIGDLRLSLVPVQHQKPEDRLANDDEDAAPDGDNGREYCSDYFADFSVDPERVLLVFYYSSSIVGVMRERWNVSKIITN